MPHVSTLAPSGAGAVVIAGLPHRVAVSRHLADRWSVGVTVAVLCTPPPTPSPRSLNELRVLLLEANRHSPGPERDLSREVHKAEWRIKEQKLKDDIRGLREKLTGLVCGGRER